ncbi:MAG: hypothetical protein JNL38_14795 [Myxococcales bacterium]|nr:hypothetical protein [Myxococcales bacterium]
MRSVVAGALSVVSLSCGGAAEPPTVDEPDFVDHGDTVTLAWALPPDTVVQRVGYADLDPFAESRVCFGACPRIYELELDPPDGTNVLRARGSPFVPVLGESRGALRFRPCGAPIAIVLEHPGGPSVHQTHVRCTFRLRPTRGERTWG